MSIYMYSLPLKTLTLIRTQYNIILIYYCEYSANDLQKSYFYFEFIAMFRCFCDTFFCMDLNANLVLKSNSD